MNSPGDRSDRRQFTRVPLSAAVQITGPDAGSWSCTLLDISLNGALVTEPPDWGPPAGSECELLIELQDGVQIRMRASIAHQGAGRVGFRCESIESSDLSVLKRLAESSMGEKGLLEQEF